MGLVDRIDEIRRADPVTMEEFGYLLAQGRGGQVRSKAGVSVSTTTALSIPAYWRGMRYLSETVAGLPVHHYRRRPGNQRARQADPLWMAQPDLELPWFGFIEHYMVSMLGRGNGFSFKLRDQGIVTGLRPIHPDRVRYGLTGGVKVFEVRDDKGETLPFTSREIFHIPAFSSDGYFGVDPIRAHATALGIELAAEEYASRFYAGGANIGSYISMPGRLDDAEAEKVKAQWDRLHKGLAHAHEFGVIGDGATYHTVGLDPVQSQLLGSRKFGVTEVARMLGAPPHKLYDLERATYSNIEHSQIDAVTDSILPWLTRLEAWFGHDRSLVRPLNFIEFQVEGLLRGDTKSRYEAYTAATGGPWMAGNEVRQLENRPPIEGLDDVLRPLAMTPVGDTDGTPAEVAAIAQKIYLAVVNGLITDTEARQLLIAAGAEIPAALPVGAAQ